MHITVTQERLARAGDNFLGWFFIFLRHFCCFSGLSLVLHLNITANIFYFAANCLDPGVPYQGAH